MLDWIWKEAATLGNLGQAFTALVAGIALGFAWAQISTGRRAQREATLDELNLDHNRLCLEKPWFANPALALVDVANEKFNNDAFLFEQYRWFVITGNCVLDRGLRGREKKQWRAIVREWQRTHFSILSSDKFTKDRQMYEPLLWDEWIKTRKEVEIENSKKEVDVDKSRNGGGLAAAC